MSPARIIPAADAKTATSADAAAAPGSYRRLRLVTDVKEP
jgi:hypothetical protein